MIKNRESVQCAMKINNCCKMAVYEERDYPLYAGTSTVETKHKEEAKWPLPHLIAIRELSLTYIFAIKKKVPSTIIIKNNSIQWLYCDHENCY